MKMFLENYSQKSTLKIGLKKFLSLKKLKILFLDIFNRRVQQWINCWKVLWKKTPKDKSECRIDNKKKKVITVYLSGKFKIIRLIAGLIKKIALYKMNSYLDPDICGGNKIKIESDLPNYAVKSDLKKATGVDISDFAKKTDLTSVKSDVDK